MNNYVYNFVKRVEIINCNDCAHVYISPMFILTPLDFSAVFCDVLIPALVVEFVVDLSCTPASSFSTRSSAGLSLQRDHAYIYIRIVFIPIMQSCIHAQLYATLNTCTSNMQ